jgi:putative transcriptional regulator
MQPLSRFLRSLAFLMVLLAGLAGAARAAGPSPGADLSQAVLLVASRNQTNSVYEKAVVLAAPLPDGGHVGIIVNRPIGVKLESLFPDQPSTRNVTEQVYLGGPVQPTALLALTHQPPNGDSSYLALMPGLVAVLDADSVDQIIEATPNEARYFLGFTFWGPDKLADEIKNGDWVVRPADAHSVLPTSTSELWESLSGDFI